MIHMPKGILGSILELWHRRGGATHPAASAPPRRPSRANDISVERRAPAGERDKPCVLAGPRRAELGGLFDRRPLDGWCNGTARRNIGWEDGAIVGRTREGSPNSFLTTNVRRFRVQGPTTAPLRRADSLEDQGAQHGRRPGRAGKAGIRSRRSGSRRALGRRLVYSGVMGLDPDGLSRYLVGQAEGLRRNPAATGRRVVRRGRWPRRFT
jgi:hypothetical protein